MQLTTRLYIPSINHIFSIITQDIEKDSDV